MTTDWSMRRQVRFALAAVAAVASIGFWLATPAYTDRLFYVDELLGMFLLGVAAVLGSATAVIALSAAARNVDTPEIAVLVLLFTGGIVMLLGLVAVHSGAFALGLALFAAAAACIGDGASKRETPAKKARARE